MSEVKSIINKIITLSIVCTILSSCAFPLVKDTKDKLQIETKGGDKAFDNFNSDRIRSNLVSFSDKPYLGSSSYTISHQKKSLPRIFDEKYSINTNQKKSFESYIARLSQIKGLRILISEDAIAKLVLEAANTSGGENQYEPSSDSISQTILKQDKIKYAMSFSGSIKEYIDDLTNHFQLSWRYIPQSDEVLIFHTETKSFTLVVPNSDITAASTISNTNVGNDSSVKYSTTKSNAFQEAVDTIKSMSVDPKDIKVASNKTFSIVTVTATPTIIERVKTYVDKFNKEAKKAVQVKISVYEVKTDKKSNYGIDWNLVYNGTNSKMNWTTSGISNIAMGGLTTATVRAGVAGGMWAGSNIVASAMQDDLGARYITGYTFYSLNGQITPLNNGQQTGYVSKLETVVIGGGFTNSTSQSVTQGTIQTGFTGTVLSNVIGDDDIFLRLSINMSKLLKLETVDYGSTNEPSSIQIPTTEDSKIFQNIIIKSGQTAVITGFTGGDTEVDTSSIGNKGTWWLGGNQSTQNSKTVLVVIVSAYNIGG